MHGGDPFALVEVIDLKAGESIEAGIKRIFAERDFVIAHLHGVRRPGQRGSAIVDIFRLEAGKIVEHWDVIQPVPEDAANPNGMF
jgi:predicted SnoaL-like aldol condensation-catalyzing enzyme